MKKLSLTIALCLTLLLLISCGEGHTHTGGVATCELGAVCEECGIEYTASLGHEWSYEESSTPYHFALNAVKL